MAKTTFGDKRYWREVIPNRLIFTAISELPRSLPPNSHWFCIDDKLLYWNFFLDFGPLNLGQLYRFCGALNDKLQAQALKHKTIYFFCSSHPHQRTNAAFLISAWQVLYLGRSPDQAFQSVERFDLEPFHDATPGVCTFRLGVHDCLCGLYKARHYGFFNFDRFDLAEYEYYEAVENGDLNWIVEGKIFAFAGPHDAEANDAADGYRALPPEHFVPYFVRKNVTLIIRLNKSYYNASKFTNIGADFADLYYLDGSNPPLRILKKFISLAEGTKGAFGVHCKAGLGRTGTCIGCFLMKHYKFTAEEIIGWMRICRPGCVIGQQQHFLKYIEQSLWREGDAYRVAHGLMPIVPVLHCEQPQRQPVRTLATSTKSQIIPVSGKSESLHDTLPNPVSAPTAGSKEGSSSQGDELRRRRHVAARTF